MKNGFNQEILKRLCIDLKKTDSEIADFFKVDRTAIVHQRKKYGIKKNPNIGPVGEKFVIKQLMKRGFEVKDLNKEDKTSIYDILVNDFIRIEVKTSSACMDRGKPYFSFILTEKPQTKCKESPHRIRLKNGRTKKLYSKTCDFLILVGILEKRAIPFIIPSNFFSDTTQGVKVPADIDSKSVYNQFRNRWGILEIKNNSLRQQ